MIELAVGGLYRAEYDAMRDWAARAADAAAPLGDQALVAAALGVRAVAGALSGAIPEARAHRDEAAALIDELGDEELARRLDALVHLATAEMYLDQFEASGRHAERALGIGRATGQGDLFPLIVPMLGTALWMQGRMAESARGVRRRGRGRAAGGQPAGRRLEPLQPLVRGARGRRRRARARHRGAEHRDRQGARRDACSQAAAYWRARRRCSRTGAPKQAAELLVAEVGGDELRLIAGRLAGGRARAADALPARRRPARRGRARRRGGGGVRRGGRAADGHRDGRARRRARSTSTPGIRRAPPSAALEAAAAARRRGRRLLRRDGARARRARARPGRRAGPAAAELERAAAAFDSFGSASYRAAAEQELRKLGHRIHRRTRPGKADETGVGSLTARELEIARLVVDRKTNPEIAAALFLSPKTVETHLRNVFHKLDVSSRVEVARAVERSELA